MLTQPELQEQDLKDIRLLWLWYIKIDLRSCALLASTQMAQLVNRTLYRRRNELLFPPFSMLKFSLHTEEIPPLCLMSQKRKEEEKKSKFFLFSAFDM